MDKLGAPVNRLSNKLGAEAFWPTTLDKESDKAARILQSFCKDGFYEDEDRPSPDSPKGKQKVVKKIPAEVIRRAKGLAIFTTMRTGLWVSGAGGSGILVGRTASGEWSPPSGIMLHTAGLGFLVGVDIYDCVIVINSEKALEAFTKIRCTVGGEISAVAGPVGVGGILETEIHKRQAPVWTYLKSRGFYAGVQVDGTVVIERTDENERFYGQRIGVADILAGKVRHAPYETRKLLATIKAAQGDTDVDQAILPDSGPTPGDLEVERMDDSPGFGLPPPDDDPDPFGVHALEKEGMEIREAGTRSRPSSGAFEYKPSTSSPIYGAFSRRSLDGTNLPKRGSRASMASMVSERGTQTEDLSSYLESPKRSGSRTSSPLEKTTQNLAEEDGEDDTGEHDVSDMHQANHPSPIVGRARIVSIPKRIPPALPPRSPYRSKGTGTPNGDSLDSVVEPEPQNEDITDQCSTSEADYSQVPTRQEPNLLSPRKDGFDTVSLSESDYSKGTPFSIEEEKDENRPVAMYDNSVDDTVAAWNNPAAYVDSEHGAKAGIGTNDDEFHSIPTTPIRVATPVEEVKHAKEDDFS